MTNTVSMLTNLKASWVLNFVVIAAIVGGFIVSDARFRSHVAERESVVDKRLVAVELEQTAAEDDIDSLRENMSENAVEFARLATTVKHIEEKVDQVLAELRRR